MQWRATKPCSVLAATERLGGSLHNRCLGWRGGGEGRGRVRDSTGEVGIPVRKGGEDVK